MIFNKDTAKKTAEVLLQINAIKLQPNDPFTWASGWQSPIYCDNRMTLSHPRIRTYIRQELVKVIDDKFGTPDVIAGVATGAIAHGVLVAEAMGLPFIYVRPTVKEHGRNNIIEGVIKENQSCVVIEDLVSTGKSSLSAVNALRDKGFIVKGLVSIFNYGFNIAVENFRIANCPVYSLSDYNSLIEEAVKQGYIQQDSEENLREWRTNPEIWKQD